MPSGARRRAERASPWRRSPRRRRRSGRSEPCAGDEPARRFDVDVADHPRSPRPARSVSARSCVSSHAPAHEFPIAAAHVVGLKVLRVVDDRSSSSDRHHRGGGVRVGDDHTPAVRALREHLADRDQLGARAPAAAGRDPAQRACPRTRARGASPREGSILWNSRFSISRYGALGSSVSWGTYARSTGLEHRQRADTRVGAHVAPGAERGSAGRHVEVSELAHRGLDSRAARGLSSSPSQGRSPA